ncbi:MAG: Response regulator receiver protein [Candidatus Moranbacteria bacterium GW2011_GWE1_49_15]|nr:MAG: Response regulator receiver protein [Candidatus Moranbacteria bacterium GW2011_GWE2_47_10]KKW07398.1 MAG: Response regulator receiver protein [Candidatus Moranbacteria bacterium GW2011_GWE1_49_15]HBP00901.1 response regulator [Candidatus Moranbacteria bacterium]
MDKKKLLIVEDEPVLNKALQEFLSAEGFEVIAAVDGEEGIRKAGAEMPDLILLDIILPKKDGYEVIREVKADEKTKNIPIILLTNLGSINDVEKALELGATTYLVKADYKLEEITQKIKGILGMD